MRDRLDLLTGVLLGTAVGDSLGLPREGLSPRRAEALYGSGLRQCFLFGHGMISDDTEHTCLTGQALLRGGDADSFARHLAGGLRGWLATFPAGIGLATLRACLRLWLGFPPSRSGVWSAGNGPAMRAALLGVCLGDRPEVLRAFVRASTRLTHTDPRAERGALLVALAARHGAVHGPGEIAVARFLSGARQVLTDRDGELDDLLRRLENSLARGDKTATFAVELGLSRGVSGYIYHTVPVVLHAWLSHPGDFRRAVEAVVLPGGDADTTGAILGGIAGATCGAAAIPPEWLRLAEWPRSVGWLRRLAERLEQAYPAVGPGYPVDPPPLCWPALWPRNLFFFAVVLAHLGRRLLPPYR